jgi:CHAT domain-containing protein
MVNVTEAIGFPVAFLRLGFAGAVGSLWPIRDDGAALLMARFHQIALKSPPAAALAQAQRWLRNLSREEASEILRHPIEQDFSGIETWAAFTFTGA